MQVALLLLCSLHLSYQQAAGQLHYPDVRRDESIKETKFGIEVADPYRWLEDAESNETKQFVDAQNKLTQAYLQGADVPKLTAKVTKMWTYPTHSYPFRVGNRYFYISSFRDVQSGMLYNLESLNGTPEVFLDPKQYSTGGSISLYQIHVSEDVLAFITSESGITLRFKNLTTGIDLPDVIENLGSTGLEFECDNRGIYYSEFTGERESTSEGKYRVKFHTFGTKLSDDIEVVKHRNGSVLTPEKIICDKWLVLIDFENAYLYTVNLTSVRKNETAPTVLIADLRNTDSRLVGSVETKLIYLTNKDAPNCKLIQIDLNNYARDNWNTLVPEQKGALIQFATAVSDKIVISYLYNFKSVLRVFSLDNGTFIQELNIPIGIITSLTGRPEQSDVLFSLSSFVTPGTIYRIDLSNLPIYNAEVLVPPVVGGLDDVEYKTTRVFFKSKDTTNISMYIIHKKTTVLDGTNPCLLHADFESREDGGRPYFEKNRFIFMKHLNGVMAVANIRDYVYFKTKGDEDGSKLNQQKSFDDYQAAAQYLIDNGYTNSKMLVLQTDEYEEIMGAVSINQRPDLFGAAVINTGYLDLLRIQNYTDLVEEYGDPDDEIHYKNLLKISPLQNIKIPIGQFPATLVTTEQDEDNAPGLSYKFIAALQYTLRNHTAQTNALLLKVYNYSGSDIDRSIPDAIEEAVDTLSFIQRALKLTFVE